MATARQKNVMLRRLHAFFKDQGRILTEGEYATSGGPYRMVSIQRGLKSYSAMVKRLQAAYPEWVDTEEIVTKPSPLEALKLKKVETSDEDE